jgi:hypothetical protein
VDLGPRMRIFKCDNRDRGCMTNAAWNLYGEAPVKKSVIRMSSVVAGVCLILARVSLAAPSRVSVDLSSVSGASFQLEIDLYDNSGVTGDSWALIDNLSIGTSAQDFEGGTLQGFDKSLNPASVSVVSGTLLGGGSQVMRISEDPVVTPTIVFRNYLSPDGTVLSFDYDVHASLAAGPLGLDELVVSILDPDTLEPLLPGVNGFGDVLSANASGVQHSDEVTLSGSPTIPAPGALLLGLIGAAGVGAWRKARGVSREGRKTEVGG